MGNKKVVSDNGINSEYLLFVSTLFFFLNNNMVSIKEITTEQLFDIADLATGGYFLSGFCTEQKEEETGGYGKRRLLSWVFEGEKNYFEINASEKKRGWHWYSWNIDIRGKKFNAHCLNAPAIVDYCDKHNIDIRNKKMI